VGVFNVNGSYRALIREHVRFTTQPMEDPENRNDVVSFLDWMHADELLCFSTDYPHWSYDDPAWSIQRMPKERRSRIMARNAIELFGLPRTVPALEQDHV
jgi:predicted TIM-barrel fold metal-dependent hydrolase